MVPAYAPLSMTRCTHDPHGPVARSIIDFQPWPRIAPGRRATLAASAAGTRASLRTTRAPGRRRAPLRPPAVSPRRPRPSSTRPSNPRLTIWSWSTHDGYVIDTHSLQSVCIIAPAIRRTWWEMINRSLSPSRKVPGAVPVLASTGSFAAAGFIRSRDRRSPVVRCHLELTNDSPPRPSPDRCPEPAVGRVSPPSARQSLETVACSPGGAAAAGTCPRTLPLTSSRRSWQCIASDRSVLSHRPVDHRAPLKPPVLRTAQHRRHRHRQMFNAPFFTLSPLAQSSPEHSRMSRSSPHLPSSRWTQWSPPIGRGEQVVLGPLDGLRSRPWSPPPRRRAPAPGSSSLEPACRAIVVRR